MYCLQLQHARMLCNRPATPHYVGRDMFCEVTAVPDGVPGVRSLQPLWPRLNSRYSRSARNMCMVGHAEWLVGHIVQHHDMARKAPIIASNKLIWPAQGCPCVQRS
jgi:hypothetical protein